MTSDVECGLSLLELMVALALISILSLCGYSAYRGLAATGVIERDASQLLHEIESASAAAIDLGQVIFGEIEKNRLSLYGNDGTPFRSFSFSTRITTKPQFGTVPATGFATGNGTTFPRSPDFALYPNGTSTAGTIELTQIETKRSCTITQSTRARRKLLCR